MKNINREGQSVPCLCRWQQVLIIAAQLAQEKSNGNVEIKMHPYQAGVTGLAAG
jgi:hypothetical protein